MNKKLVAAAMLTLASAGCMTLGEQGEAIAASDHFVVVTVGGGTIGVDKPEIEVRGRDQVIFWNLRNGPGQNYSFPTDGIHFKSPEGKAEFRCMRQNPTRFRCLDRGVTKGRFEYGVKLTGSPAVPELDPFVVNN